MLENHIGVNDLGFWISPNALAGLGRFRSPILESVQAFSRHPARAGVAREPQDASSYNRHKCPLASISAAN